MLRLARCVCNDIVCHISTSQKPTHAYICALDKTRDEEKCIECASLASWWWWCGRLRRRLADFSRHRFACSRVWRMQTSFDFTEFRLHFNVSDAPEAASDLRVVQINRNIGCLVVMIQPFFPLQLSCLPPFFSVVGCYVYINMRKMFFTFVGTLHWFFALPAILRHIFNWVAINVHSNAIGTFDVQFHLRHHWHTRSLLFIRSHLF